LVFVAFRVAYESAVECLREDGWDVTGPNLGMDGVSYSIGYNSSVTPQSDVDGAARDQENADFEKKHDECMAVYVDPIRDEYLSSIRLTGAERDEEYRRMIACMEDAGVTGVKVGDEEGVVGELVGDNVDAVLCLQRSLWQLFGG
jgi:hypothetical protein